MSQIKSRPKRNTRNENPLYDTSRFQHVEFEEKHENDTESGSSDFELIPNDSRFTSNKNNEKSNNTSNNLRLNKTTSKSNRLKKGETASGYKNLQNISPEPKKNDRKLRSRDDKEITINIDDANESEQEISDNQSLAEDSILILEKQNIDEDLESEENSKLESDDNTETHMQHISALAQSSLPKNENELRKLHKLYLLDKEPKLERAKDRADTVKRFKYLLSLTDLFRDFISTRIKKDLYLKKIINEYEKSMGISSKSKRPGSRRRKTEKEEDMELLYEEEEDIDENQSNTTTLTESPSFINGKLRDYQIQGLNWLISLHENCLSGILADEMGLGKTLQTISFLGYLRYLKGIKGPHIVIVPKSTLDNWKREFVKWTPEVNVFLFSGNKEERQELVKTKLLTCDFDIAITSFETVIREKAQLKKIRWQYIIVDEAHRIKNEESSLSQIIRLFYSKSRLLITGTPLQNNLHELWALLNFLLPDVFGEAEVFDQWFSSTRDEEDSVDSSKDKEEDNVMIDKLHQILSPFLLRRVKIDVEKSLLPKKELNLYVGMSEMQLKWYKKLLEKDIDAVNGAVGKREGKTRLLNIVMQLRKCCNHPYLFERAEPGPPFTTDEHLVYNSGKLQILDKLLKKFKKEGSRVLIFSQMSRLLDILEDYCYFRNYEYCRIDGSTSHEERINAIDEYNMPDSEKFIFLLTTRAGGLGINLTTANIVVLYDSDWNPQADLQAMDRAHRIGQKKQVEVYRFVTENAIEEKVLERATQKLRLDQLVIQQGRMNGNNSTLQKRNKVGDTKDDLLSLIQHGAREVFESSKPTFDLNEDIDSILLKSREKTDKLNAKFNKLGLDDLQKFTSDSSAYEWNGQNFSKKSDGGKFSHNGFWLNPGRRERKEHKTYSVDGYYKDVLHQNFSSSNLSHNGKPVKAPKPLNIQDHQFYPKELDNLLEKENNFYKRQINYLVPLSDIELTWEDVENIRKSLSENDSDDKDEPFEVIDDDSYEIESSDSDVAERNDFKQDIKKALKGMDAYSIRKYKEQKRKEQQALIKIAEPLTEKEEDLKKKFIDESFGNWSRRDFTNFVHSNAKFGRKDYVKISEELGNKAPEEVERYSKVFWQKYQEIEGHNKYILQIENGEKRLSKILLQSEILQKKLDRCKAPLEDFIIQYPPNNSKRVYTELEDRYILIMANKFGLTSDNLFEKIKECCESSDLFKFDWFLRSRTTQELSRRCNTLLLAVTREFEGPNALKRKREKKSKKDNTPIVEDEEAVLNKKVKNE